MEHNLRNWKVKRDDKKKGEGRMRNRSRCDMCSRKLAKYAHQKTQSGENLEKVGPAQLRLCWRCHDAKYGSGRIRHRHSRHFGRNFEKAK